MPIISKSVGLNHHLYSCIQIINKITQETEIANRENFESYVARLGLVVEEKEMDDVVPTGLVVAVVPGVVVAIAVLDNELVVPNVVTGASVVVAAPTHPPIM